MYGPHFTDEETEPTNLLNVMQLEADKQSC